MAASGALELFWCYNRFLLEHLTVCSDEPTATNDRLTVREQVCAQMLSSVLCSYSIERAARHHRQCSQWMCINEGEKRQTVRKAGRQVVNTHESLPILFFKTKSDSAFTRTTFASVGAKQIRLGEVCGSQTVSLHGSNPSAH